ncbi:MAG: twitch domain-containing radical SAM protein [Bacteroidota bacterium]
MKTILQKYEQYLYPAWHFYNSLKARLLNYPRSGKNYKAISRDKMIQYNHIRYHGAKRLFCYNPFVNVFFNIDGNAIACCRSHENILGTYPDQGIKDIWFGKKYEKMREHMRHNDLNMGCEYCKMQLKSNRFHAIPSMAPEKYASGKSGIYPRTMELELSNKCNLHCIMCTGRQSSAIRKHRDKLPPIESPYDDNFVEELKAFMPHLKDMYFFGGEPFLIDIYYKIWEEVIKINPKIRLFAVSNGTIFNERIEKLLTATIFNVTISLDSLRKERFEHIREGAKFETVMHNINKFSSLIMGNLTISHTPMQINWDETPAIINFCNQQNARINLSYVESPAKFALWAMPPEKLDAIYNYYDSVKWKSTPNKVTAKYNIMVFNEWKEQVKYFRDKNREILKNFGDIPSMYKTRKEKLTARLKQVIKETPGVYMNQNIAFNIINSEIFQKSRTPAQIEAMDKLLNILYDHEKIHSAKGHIILNDPDELKSYLANLIQEDEFWAKHY